tara:strand:+ start:234 stop:692 length:459 start_codon:yes stop_codon:yes gene_type:complete
MTIYDHYMANPPVTQDGHRKKGNTPQHAFWVGFDGGPVMGPPTSNARRAWKAGRDTAKANKAKGEQSWQVRHDFIEQLISYHYELNGIDESLDELIGESNQDAARDVRDFIQEMNYVHDFNFWSLRPRDAFSELPTEYSSRLRDLLTKYLEE